MPTPYKLIGVRHVGSAGFRTPVLLTRNARGTVSAQCLLGGAQRPIVDGPSVTEVLALLEDTIEAIVCARSPR